MFKKALPIPVLVFDNWKKYDHILDKKITQTKQNNNEKNTETLNDDMHCRGPQKE